SAGQWVTISVWRTIDGRRSRPGPGDLTGGSMHRFLFIVVATALLAAATVALASASSTAAGKKAAPTPEGVGYLPQGVTPCGNDWPMAACDLSSTAFSNLTQINKSNVAKLKVAWQISLEKPETSTTWPPQNQPI